MSVYAQVCTIFEIDQEKITLHVEFGGNDTPTCVLILQHSNYQQERRYIETFRKSI
jgi:hypothetical protein